MKFFNKLYIKGDWGFGDGFGLSIEKTFSKWTWLDKPYKKWVAQYSLRVLFWYCIIGVTYQPKGFHYVPMEKLND